MKKKTLKAVFALALFFVWGVALNLLSSGKATGGVKAANHQLTISNISDITFGEEEYYALDVTVTGFPVGELCEVYLYDEDHSYSRIIDSQGRSNFVASPGNVTQIKFYINKRDVIDGHKYYFNIRGIKNYNIIDSNSFKISKPPVPSTKVFSRIALQEFERDSTIYCPFTISNIPEGNCTIACKNFDTGEIISTMQQEKQAGTDMRVNYEMVDEQFEDGTICYFELTDSNHNIYRSNTFYVYLYFAKKTWSENCSLTFRGDIVHIESTLHCLNPWDKYRLQLHQMTNFNRIDEPYKFFKVKEFPCFLANGESQSIIMDIPKSYFQDEGVYVVTLFDESRNYERIDYTCFGYPSNIYVDTSYVEPSNSLLPSSSAQPTAIPSPSTPPTVTPSASAQPHSPSPTPSKMKIVIGAFPTIHKLTGKYLSTSTSEIKIPNTTKYKKIEYKLVYTPLSQDDVSWRTLKSGTIQLKKQGDFYIKIRAYGKNDNTMYVDEAILLNYDKGKPTIKKIGTKKGKKTLVIQDKVSGIKSIKVDGVRVKIDLRKPKKKVKIKIKKGQTVVVIDRAGNKKTYKG